MKRQAVPTPTGVEEILSTGKAAGAQRAARRLPPDREVYHPRVPNPGP